MYFYKTETYRTHSQKFVKCIPCGRHFANQEKLILHQKSHDLNCISCSKTFTSISGKWHHFKIIHENCIKCKTCDRLFSDKEKYKTHEVQCKEKEIRCTFCGKIFKRPGSLSDHKKRHQLK